jgi:Cytochrome c oxidase caa3 assembly factor (Caa3_CtaG)
MLLRDVDSILVAGDAALAECDAMASLVYSLVPDSWECWRMMLFSAFLAFCDRVIYPSYATASGLLGLSPLEDQAISGALMWVFGTLIYLVPAVAITVQILMPRQSRERPRADRPASSHDTAIEFPQTRRIADVRDFSSCFQLGCQFCSGENVLVAAATSTTETDGAANFRLISGH